MTAAGSVMVPSGPEIVALIKRGSGFSDASLSGAYHFSGFAVSFGSTFSYFGVITFDGIGSAALNLGFNIEGAISPPAPTTATYSVAADGQVTLTFTGGDAYTGTILPDGGLALLGGSTINGQAPAALALVPKTSGASNATLNGTYQLIGMEREGSGFTSLTGSVVADGSGSLTATFTRNTDGVITTSGPDIVSYSIDADSTLRIDPAGEEFIGGVSPTGAYAILGGPTLTGTNPKFFVLMRR
jgi:hypothetical protein